MILQKKDLESFINEFKSLKAETILAAWKYFQIVSRSTMTDQTDNFKEYLEHMEMRKKLDNENWKINASLAQIKERIQSLGHDTLENIHPNRVEQNLKAFSSAELRETIEIASFNANKRLTDYANDELIKRAKLAVADPDDTTYDLTPSTTKQNAVVPTHIEELEQSQKEVSNHLNALWNSK